MYQGAAEDFSVFDRKKSKPSNLYGRGFYFTDSVTNANLYGNARAFYLNITNPLSTDKRTITRVQMRKFLNAVAKNEDYGIENYGTSDVGEVLASVYSGKSDFAMIQDVNATCIGDLVAAVELFNEVNGTSYDGFILPTESVTFQSAQAKLTSNKTPTLDPNISYSLPDDMDSEYKKPITAKDIETLRAIGRKSINAFTSEDIKKAQKWAYKFYKEMGTKSPFFRAWFGDWRAFDHSEYTPIVLDKTATVNSGNAVNDDTKRKMSWSKDVAKESTLNAPKKYKNDIAIIAANLSKVVEKSILLDTVVSDDTSSRKLQGSSWMHSLYCAVEHDGKVSLIKLFAEEVFSEKQNLSFTRAYTLKHIEKIAEIDNGVLSYVGGLTGSFPATINSISDLFAFVKAFDKEFSPKPVNELMLNDDGTPKVFYHGTRSQFTEFILQNNPRFGRALGDGFYFTPSYSKAHQFANGLFSRGEDRGGIVMPVYLRMENPFVIEKTADRTKWRNEYYKGDYDGIIDLKNQTWYVEGSTQIKSATDNVGTFDGTNPDIRFSLPSDLDPNAPLLDENGKPIPYESFVDRGVPYAKSPEMSVGQMRKEIANVAHSRVYSKKAMLDIVNQFPGADFLHAATRDKIADSM